MGLTFLVTETGEEIVTESGSPIVVSEALTNGDVELFDFSVNLLQALLWQYNEATNLQTLLEEKAAWYQTNQTNFWTNWFQDVFDLTTANDFGLAVWSIILGQPIFLNNQPSNWPTFGFGSGNLNFGRGGFGTLTGNTYRFQTETARLLLRLRYFQLVSSGTVPETNRMLKYLFQNYGQAFLIDNLDMTQRYFFGFAIPADMLLMLESFDILPRPAAVKSTIYQGAFKYFGFGPNNANFSNGGFAD